MTAGGDGPADDVGASAEDFVIPFHIETAGSIGRFIRADHAVDAILSRHGYPEPVAALLGEALTLAAMLGAALKIDGRFILQTSSDGPVTTLVAQYRSGGDMRGYASFNPDSLESDGAVGERGGAAALLGSGHLAMTIDPGAGMERYQGVVALEGANLTDAADLYFRQSEQIPTYIRVAVARGYDSGANGRRGGWSWRAAGIMVQKLTSEGGAKAAGDALDWQAPDADEDWVRARTLAATVEDHELLDAALAPERLLYRLFNEERVRAFPPTAVKAQCSCNRERIEELLNTFGKDELGGMAEEGVITVKCEFCNRKYQFDPAALTGQS